MNNIKETIVVKTHNLGFPRIGEKRQLKFALEKYWRGEASQADLEQTGKELRRRNWRHQSHLDYMPIGDFSFYDQVLDASFMLGNIPSRIADLGGAELDHYFRTARGRSAADEPACSCVSAGEMTKWFDTNYHYIVPEFDNDSCFELNAERLLSQLEEARAFSSESQDSQPKPVIIGPVSYLWLGKARDGSNKLDLLDKLLPVYGKLLEQLAQVGVEWVQLDEPLLATELSSEWRHALRKAYFILQSAAPLKILLATYFGELQENLQLACELPVNGFHLDAVSARSEVLKLIDWLPSHRVVSLGVINGRNIWKTDLQAQLDWLEPIHERLQGRLWLAPSCSLLHVPVDLDSEDSLDPEIKSWLAFALQKLQELETLAIALNHGRESVAAELAENSAAIAARRKSMRVHDQEVKQRINNLEGSLEKRCSAHTARADLQKRRFDLPLFPTSTIGSFPQTSEIRRARRDFREGELTEDEYRAIMQDEIKRCVKEQEQLGLDVLVHGEPERNDMVEYFGEQLNGYAFSRFGWVQSYGSRCVKPPILYGDISRPEPMTVEWARFAQSLTSKPMKGMLTGPVTMLNWSFVRDDQARSETCLQLALAIRDEVLDLEQAGISIIQIDEAALREGLPLRKSQWKDYLDWAIRAFRISANGVADKTQIHTHMCYSEFNDIIEAIADMDADVITIETSRSDMELLDVFDSFQYPNEIGPGVYDIHSPNLPSVESMIELMQKACERIPAERLWVNPDCGLKTRSWEEVRPALANMVAASRQLSERYTNL